MDDEREDDWLDAKLREEAPYIDDAGFTALVMHQLPAARPKPRASRGVILGLITLLAFVAAYVVSGGGSFLGESAAYLVAMPLWTICLLAGLSGLLVMGLGTAAAMKTARPPR